MPQRDQSNQDGDEMGKVFKPQMLMSSFCVKR